VIDGADHVYSGTSEMLAAAIAGWLPTSTA
jgi:hypothetical protein